MRGRSSWCERTPCRAPDGQHTRCDCKEGRALAEAVRREYERICREEGILPKSGTPTT